jgi:histidyl-tRNA synthetase
MESQGAQRLPGMRDLFEEENRRSRRVRDGLQSFLSLYGYRTVDTPVVEPTDIFLRKSGGEMASQMYTFMEPGGHEVSLRPEFTSQVIRLFLQEKGNQPNPVRWQYAGPVFRYSTTETRYGRQYTQVGAELIGAAGASAEAEVMAMACGALASLGLVSQRLIVGDVGAVLGLLRQFRLSERATYFLLHAMGELRDGEDGLASVRTRGQELGLFDSPERQQGVDALSQHLAASEASQNEVGDGSIGVRSTREILERLERKLQAAAPDSAGFEKALAFTQTLTGLRGAPNETLKAARTLAGSHKLDAAPLNTLEASLGAFALHDLKSVEVSVDLGLARDIAYYTGPVFELRVGSGDGVRLGGGGRYDGLVKALGGSEDVPALGFACTLELVVGVLNIESGDARPAKRVLVAPKSGGAVKATLQAANSLRLGGEVAEVSLDGTVDHVGAKAQGFEAIIMVDEDGTSERIWL